MHVHATRRRQLPSAESASPPVCGLCLLGIDYNIRNLSTAEVSAADHPVRFFCFVH